MTIDQARKLVRAEQVTGDSIGETMDLRGQSVTARRYLEQFRWCEEVVELYSGFQAAGVLGVFLARIVPRVETVDEWLWVVCGDVPPAYLVLDDAPDAMSALALYIDMMSRWVEAMLNGSQTDDLIPVNAPATLANAMSLRARLEVLRRFVSDHSVD